MGKIRKFDHDKSYQVIALNAFEELYEELSVAKSRDGKNPEVEITVKGDKSAKFTIPAENIGEVLEILKLAIKAS